MDGNALGRRIRQLRVSAGITQKDLAERVGVERSYIGHIERGRAKLPSREVLVSMAHALNVSVQELLTALYELQSGGGEDVSMPFGMIRVPIRGSAPGGAFFIEDERAMGHFSLPPEELRGAKRPYIVWINGDSMEPGLSSRDMAIVDPDGCWKDGDVVLARMDGGVTLKRVYHTDHTLRLVPDNRKYREIEISEGLVEILGVVINTVRFGGKP